MTGGSDTPKGLLIQVPLCFGERNIPHPTRPALLLGRLTNFFRIAAIDCCVVIPRQ